MHVATFLRMTSPGAWPQVVATLEVPESVKPEDRDDWAGFHFQATMADWSARDAEDLAKRKAEFPWDDGVQDVRWHFDVTEVAGPPANQGGQ